MRGEAPQPHAPWRFRSAVPGILWPSLPAPEAAAVLSLLQQFEQTQWLAPEALARMQLRQLEGLLRHAFETVPHYREAWNGRLDLSRPLDAARFSRLPVLTRAELQRGFEQLTSTAIPPGHGPVGEARTSGSTGMPVRVRKTRLTLTFWKAVTLREHLWQGRDLSRKLAAIRRSGQAGRSPGWGIATDGVVETGPSAVLGVSADIDRQLQWLEEEQPDYLLTYPTNLRELARRSLERGAPALPRLREARTFGELLPDEVRELCRQAWGIPIADMYSADEVGYVALQCPQAEHYHVQAEDLLVELLDENGAPCPPGRAGRVVVTTLHNFAMPLVRYDLGDYAEAGGRCACGRGLPVLTRIVGRVRNMLLTAAGERYWPALGSRAIARIAPLRQFQLAQTAFDHIQVRLVVERPLAPQEESRLRAHILASFPPGFDLSFEYRDEIPRSAGGKFEDFVCELPAGSLAHRAA